MKLPIIRSIKTVYNSIVAWFYYCWNKPHYNMVKTAIKSYPFDGAMLYENIEAQLRDLHHYFSRKLVCREEDYKQILKWISYAISMCEIINDKRDLFDIHGDMKFIPDDEYPGFSTVDMSKTKYVCLVKVNMNNAHRFAKTSEIELYKDREHEIYVLKAKRLLFRILENYTDLWWD